jgi:hypothetical protein
MVAVWDKYDANVYVSVLSIYFLFSSKVRMLPTQW